jgi:uncharacterized membrane protein
VKTFFWTLSSPGLLLGSVFFAASLTPSLIPRDFVMQGGLGGVSFAIGYGFGALGSAIWTYLGLPRLGARQGKAVLLVSAAIAVAISCVFLAHAARWQNSIRERMTMEPVHTAHPLEVVAIAIAISLAIILLARLIGEYGRRFRRRLPSFLPERLAQLISIAFVTVLLVLLANGLLMRGFLRMADSSLQTLDAVIEPELSQPFDPNRTGSTASLIDWEDMGRMGRSFVSSGPTAVDLETFGGSARLPLRVYVGLNSAKNTEARAKLALEELIRVGGFERSILVVAVPTGRGWLDPEAVNTLEYLHRGDTAIVALQYSYLWSWLSLLVEPGYGAEAGQALFREVYRHWSSLPKGSRPKLYLHGLSLGAYGSEQSLKFYEILADPIQGAVWSGPPFASPMWSALTRGRNAGSPAWLPVYGDGSVYRFTNQNNALDLTDAEWGPMRVVYLQYASDPMTFFSTDTLWRRPDWMVPPLGPDVSPELRWYPVVTFLQLVLDMATNSNVPIGYGHVFAPEHYIDAWLEVTEPEGWSTSEIARLKARFARSVRQKASSDLLIDALGAHHQT